MLRLEAEKEISEIGNHHSRQNKVGQLRSWAEAKKNKVHRSKNIGYHQVGKNQLGHSNNVE